MSSMADQAVEPDDPDAENPPKLLHIPQSPVSCPFLQAAFPGPHKLGVSESSSQTTLRPGVEAFMAR